MIIKEIIPLTEKRSKFSYDIPLESPRSSTKQQVQSDPEVHSSPIRKLITHPFGVSNVARSQRQPEDMVKQRPYTIYKPVVGFSVQNHNKHNAHAHEFRRGFTHTVIGKDSLPRFAQNPSPIECTKWQWDDDTFHDKYSGHRQPLDIFLINTVWTDVVFTKCGTAIVNCFRHGIALCPAICSFYRAHGVGLRWQQHGIHLKIPNEDCLI